MKTIIDCKFEGGVKAIS